MNEIIKKMWARDLTLKKWAQINGFSEGYTRNVISGYRGKWNAGKAQRIVAALKAQGFWVEKDESPNRGEQGHGF